MGRCRAKKNSLRCSLANPTGTVRSKLSRSLRCARARGKLGGRVKLTLPDGDRIRLTAEMPPGRINAKPRAS